MLEAFYPMPRLPGARQLMRLVRKLHHHRRNLAELQRAKHLFAAGAGGRARVGLAEDEHQWRLHIINMSDRRASLKILRVLERRRLEPARLEQRQGRGVPPLRPAGYT